MTTDWKKRVAIAFMVRQRLAELDEQKLWPFFLPEVAANEESVQRSERHLRIQLPSEYRNFLLVADGWHCFYQAVDLFGLSDLACGERHARAVQLLQSLHPLADVCGVRPESLLPIAVSRNDIDLFLLSTSKSERPGEVFWFAGQLVETFSDFSEFFLAMVDYNREDIADFEAGKLSDSNV